MTAQNTHATVHKIEIHHRQNGAYRLVFSENQAGSLVIGWVEQGGKLQSFSVPAQGILLQNESWHINEVRLVKNQIWLHARLKSGKDELIVLEVEKILKHVSWVSPCPPQSVV